MSDERNSNQDIPETQISSQEVALQEKNKESSTPSTPTLNPLDALYEALELIKKDKAMQQEIEEKQKQLDEERRSSDLFYRAGRYVAENLGSTEVSRKIFEDIRYYTQPIAEDITMPLEARERIVLGHTEKMVKKYTAQKEEFEANHRANHDRVLGLLNRNYGEYGKDAILAEVRSTFRFNDVLSEEEADSLLYSLNHSQLEKLANQVAIKKGYITKTPPKKK
jgi:hypothetical protein